VDDHELVRAALKSTLAEAGIQVTGEASNAEDGIAIVAETAPDVVLMDLSLPGLSGIEATEHLSTIAPTSRVLIVTGSTEKQDVLQAILAGACGYLLKDSEPRAVVAAVRAASVGESVISPKIAGRLLDRVRHRDQDDQFGARLRAKLTEREVEILRLVAGGKENREIASQLYISPKTVKNHISNILTKLQLENRIQAAVHAVRSGIV
jgi:DNA-binding NarL/FixJ family response regulator